MKTKYGVEIYPQHLTVRHLHKKYECKGTYCVIHKPSNHHMKMWPINIRLDRYGALAERLCPHGVGHPDPDSLAYLEILHGGECDFEAIHGCCSIGCCATPEIIEDQQC